MAKVRLPLPNAVSESWHCRQFRSFWLAKSEKKKKFIGIYYPIQISPSHDLASLDTLIRLQPSLLNSSTTGRAYRVRFGIRYLLVNGESRDVWARASTGSRLDGLFFEAYLPTGAFTNSFFAKIYYPFSLAPTTCKLWPANRLPGPA
jgi:hypothetical protein